MYFLNGDRDYIKPKGTCALLDEQVQDIFRQLKKINSGKRIFKLNFFADTTSADDYNKLQRGLKQLVAEHFEHSVICALIAQPPLTCRILAEAFYFDFSLWEADSVLTENGSAMLFKRDDVKVLVGNAQADYASDCHGSSDAAFLAFGELLQKSGIPLDAVVRQWNYIENITGFDGSSQRYQEFNNVRTDFYAGHFNENGYPAATGIGMNRGGVIIEFVAVSAPNVLSLPLDNPEQVSAHEYSGEVLVGMENSCKSTPKFERARYLELFGKKQVFISGTASIRGELTVGIDDPVEQTKVTIQNMQRLYSRDVLSAVPGNSLRPVYGHARVYVKNRKDFAAIKKTFKSYYGNLPVVYIVADICRENLLMEIEGKVILK
ncbi:hypothetical protein SAMN05444274_102321 [Mariniphaga anaerophila]|uniref:Chorismatase FkbO/Hyg5-like N-terminal domain-containing protein n=1 Tax=Mariniphaga anaerophila TaxID=1484053 RepID=A0A1M4W551_9BACT|nr:hypothetical protein [Mariniphaga anaerophila]SHE76327.1 hypothetical protein SAMN05444274_102321 [Mariniphaga anaerophila]